VGWCAWCLEGKSLTGVVWLRTGLNGCPSGFEFQIKRGVEFIPAILLNGSVKRHLKLHAIAIKLDECTVTSFESEGGLDVSLRVEGERNQQAGFNGDVSKCHVEWSVWFMVGKSDLRIRRGGFGGKLTGWLRSTRFEGEGTPSFAIEDVDESSLGDFPVGT